VRAGDGGTGEMEETREAAVLIGEETRSTGEVWTRGMPSYRRSARANRGDRWRPTPGTIEARAGACTHAVEGSDTDGTRR
jgi:hypothetical protein